MDISSSPSSSLSPTNLTDINFNNDSNQNEKCTNNNEKNLLIKSSNLNFSVDRILSIDCNNQKSPLQNNKFMNDENFKEIKEHLQFSNNLFCSITSPCTNCLTNNLKFCSIQSTQQSAAAASICSTATATAANSTLLTGDKGSYHLKQIFRPFPIHAHTPAVFQFHQSQQSTPNLSTFTQNFITESSHQNRAFKPHPHQHHQHHHHHHHNTSAQLLIRTSNSLSSDTNFHLSPNNITNTNLNKKKRSWSRAVFSNLQRKGLENRFREQKYITKPERKKLADNLRLTDAQVKVWFQNRRMKFRQAQAMKSDKEYIDEEIDVVGD